MRRKRVFGYKLDVGAASKVCSFPVPIFAWWTSHRYTPVMQVFRMLTMLMLCNVISGIVRGVHEGFPPSRRSITKITRQVFNLCGDLETQIKGDRHMNNAGVTRMHTCKHASSRSHSRVW